ncbi:MAG: glycosyltransferase [Thermoleophilia bacterium]|nr:glycosyltransferase [Thermoleophilia bacterium]
MRILLVSSMYPGPGDPDFGTFVADLARELSRLGHEIVPAVVDRRAGSAGKQARLLADALRRARCRPDVVYAHYLVPAGVAAAAAGVAASAPLVVTAHGRDVRNVGRIPGVGLLTRLVLARAREVIAVSDYLRRELSTRFPKLTQRVEVVSAGVDLDRFRPRDAEQARSSLAWGGEPPFFLCVGSLDARKNVVRLADAFGRLGHGTLAFVGDGPVRPQLEGRERVLLTGRVEHAVVADWVAACDVLCQPSLVEPFGLALLEAMAGERSVVATRVGGPPEFVSPEAGVLVEPTSVESIEAGLAAAARLPSPNAAARLAAARYDVRGEAARVASILARAAQSP